MIMIMIIFMITAVITISVTVIDIDISLFVMLLTFIVPAFIILFHIFPNQIFLNFKHMKWPNIVQSWQYQ